MAASVQLLQKLLQYPSVTPKDEGVQAYIAEYLHKLGFSSTPLSFEDETSPPVHNLFSRLGTKGPHFCFAGHTDVVPVGNAQEWSVPPFSGTIKEDILYGRGAVDMKGAIAAFLTAVKEFLDENQYNAENFPGSLSFLITGDEEGLAINGTKKVLTWMQEQHQIPDHCLVGEPTNPTYLGEMIKIGRRGSLHFVLTVTGREGHVAYPHLADNPLPKLARMVTRISDEIWDQGNDFFQPSTLEFSTIDVGNPATNVIPKEGKAVFNIRYNTEHHADEIEQRIHEICREISPNYTLTSRLSGEPFLTTDPFFADLVEQSVQTVTGQSPDLSTGGGTSDARFIKDYCAVIEFGLVGQTMHKIDESVPIKDLENLTKIYKTILSQYFHPEPQTDDT